jgi:hypothetical protein
MRCILGWYFRCVLELLGLHFGSGRQGANSCQARELNIASSALASSTGQPPRQANAPTQGEGAILESGKFET